MWDPAQYAEQLRPHQGLGSLSTTRKVNNGSIKFSAPERRKTGLSHKQNNFFFFNLRKSFTGLQTPSKVNSF